jgi:hypothetical protein
MIFIILLVNKISYSKWANRQINIALIVLLPIVVITIVIGGAVYGIISNNHASVSSGNTTYFYSTDVIDITLDELGVNKSDNSIYEETIHDKSKSLFGKREEYSDYYYADDNSYGYSIEMFSSKFSSVIDKYNKLVLKYNDYSFKKLTDTENTWLSDQVYYGRSGNISMYVVIGEGITCAINGDLNQVQAAKLSSYYMKK